MSVEDPDTEGPLEPNAPKDLPYLARLRDWTASGGRRNTIVLGGFAAVSIGTVITWLALADLAAQPEAATIEMAIAALDNGDDDLARAIIDEIQNDNTLESVEYGGPLYVLGALKAREAERQWSDERARNDHLIASKYLGEARIIGWPEGHEARGLYLLGKSLIKSRQLRRGIEILRGALSAKTAMKAQTHLLLAEANFYAPAPDFQETINQLDTAIADAKLTARERSNALLLRAEALAAQGLGEEAVRSVVQAGEGASPAKRRLVEGKALVSQIENLLKNRGDSDLKTLRDIRPLAQEAEASLERARRLDKLSTPISRQSDYLKARVAELTGKSEEALEAYGELRRNQGSSPAGIAAGMAEGDLHRLRGEEKDALESYRRALEAISEPKAYINTLLPLDETRRRIRAAHDGFLESQRFSAADKLAGRVTPLLSRTDQLLLRSKTLRQWGEKLIEDAKSMKRQDDKKKSHRLGRSKLREAGVAYEQLAEARFATRRFTDDLWNAAESYFEGQSYESTIRVLERYLRNEPQQRNSLALLRLGEAHLARGEDNLAIAALEEVLEFHPNDAASYQARLECAKAYQARGELERAEELLRYNLTQTSLTPASPEWRDSKFQLGQLLAENHKHLEAVRELEEAVDRYPDDPQTRLARYEIAESYRHAAKEPLERLLAAQTVNERERSRNEASQYLREALDRYKEVQNEITLANSTDELDRVMLRNCYMLAGDVQFELGDYEDAIKSYSNVSTIYQNEPFVLETLVQISHCWRRLKDNVRASGAIQQAKSLLTRLPPDADFATSTNLNRTEWSQLLDKLALF